MKRIIFLFLCFFVSITARSQEADTVVIRALLTKIQKSLAPDKRSVYFNVNLKKDSLMLETTSPEVIASLNKGLEAFKGFKAETILLPSASLNGFIYGVANLSVCNNRATPQNAAEMLTQMILGTPVQVLKKQGGFYLVRTPDGYLSWTDGSAIGLMDKVAFEAWKKADKVIFTADYGHALRTASADALRVSDLVNGNILSLLGTEKDFYKVQFPDKRIGFISKKQATLFNQWVKRPDPDASRILSTAEALLGIPYLWGGTSVKGMDCSGFTKTAYFLNGIIIPRDASQQVLVGTAVDVLENDSISVQKCLKNLLPGDLLFFSAAKRRGINGGRVTHTAIYMGDGKFIQAAGMIKINSLDPQAENYDAGQSTTLVGARRILTNIGQPEITKVNDHPWYALH